MEHLIARSGMFGDLSRDSFRQDALFDIVSDGPRLAATLRAAADNLSTRRRPSLNLVSFLRQKVDWLSRTYATRERRSRGRFEPRSHELHALTRRLQGISHERQVLIRRIITVHCAELLGDCPELPGILDCLGQGYDKTQIARVMGISRGRLYRVLERFERWLRALDDAGPAA